MQNMTHKQGSFLFRLTGKKFWEPVNRPAPTIQEAAALIDACMNAIKGDDNARQRAVELAQRFFPDFLATDIRQRFYRSKKSDDSTVKEPPESTPKAQQSEPGKATSEATPETPEPQTQEPEAGPETHGEALILQSIKAGLSNIYLHGPAGCGKTTLCKEVAKRLELPCTILSCSAGTSPGEFVGFRFPTPTPSAITEAISEPGIIVLDEMPMLAADVAAVANALLANGEMETVCGHRTRHSECVIIATANTVGDGADREYVGNNQLDAATLDRFTGGMIAIDYDIEYEKKHYDAEVCDYVCGIRDAIRKLGMRRLASTRMIIAGDKLKKAGVTTWKTQLLSAWSEDDRKAVCA